MALGHFRNHRSMGGTSGKSKSVLLVVELDGGKRVRMVAQTHQVMMLAHP